MMGGMNLHLRRSPATRLQTTALRLLGWSAGTVLGGWTAYASFALGLPLYALAGVVVLAGARLARPRWPDRIPMAREHGLTVFLLWGPLLGHAVADALTVERRRERLADGHCRHPRLLPSRRKPDASVVFICIDCGRRDVGAGFPARSERIPHCAWADDAALRAYNRRQAWLLDARLAFPGGWVVSPYRDHTLYTLLSADGIGACAFGAEAASDDLPPADLLPTPSGWIVEQPGLTPTHHASLAEGLGELIARAATATTTAHKRAQIAAFVHRLHPDAAPLPRVPLPCAVRDGLTGRAL